MFDSPPRSIMLATDLTPACDRAFDRAAQLAGEWGSDLVVCHVIESSAARPWRIEQRVRNAGIELDRLVRSLQFGKNVPRHIVVGDPADRTLEHARQIGCDFIVTGPAHGKIFAEKLLGSTAARIVRRATQPVLAVRRRPEGAYKTVVSTVDFSPASRAAFAAGRALFPNVQLTAIHAYQISPDWTGPNADTSIEVVEAEERTRVLRNAEQDMADLIAPFSSAGRIETLIVEGTPEAVVGAFVDKNWPDLVVAGTHGVSGVQENSIGSVAELFLTRLHCDVLAVPTRR